MSSPSHDELLTLALGVLPPLPASVDVLSEAGGSFTLQVTQRDGELLHGFAPAGGLRQGLHLLARVFDQSRGRYEVEFELVEAFFHTGAVSLVHLAVTAVRHRKARRASARAAVSVKFNARVTYCQTLPRDTEIEVRLVDVSATGLAFVSQKELAPGDLLRLEFPLAGRRMDVEARVVRLDPAPYGRHRVGCEITEISDLDRRAITQLAEQSDAAGSAEQRRPEVAAAWAEARSQASMLQRTADQDA